jgi:hypothetical protein
MHRSLLSFTLLAACLGLPGATHAADTCSTYAADLAAMADADQALRKRFNFLEMHTPEQKKLLESTALVDRANTARLKALIARCGWPSKAVHGDQAAGNAWLLAQHADQDRAFQKQVLSLIEREAAASGAGVDRNIAYLTDRIAVAEKRPQPYGTQMKQKGEHACDLEFETLDDRQAVEERRAKLGMPTLEQYKRMFEERLHCPGGASQDYHYGPPGGGTVRRK